MAPSSAAFPAKSSPSCTDRAGPTTSQPSSVSQSSTSMDTKGSSSRTRIRGKYCFLKELACCPDQSNFRLVLQERSRVTTLRRPKGDLVVRVRIAQAQRSMRAARTVILVGFPLVLVAVLAVALLLERSRQADMWVQHTFACQHNAHTLLPPCA